MTPNLNIPVFVIDCESHKVIKWTVGMRFAALSYVWGLPVSRKKLRRQLEIDLSTALPTNLPALIEDTITVTRPLGLQFLWVDRYCVSETDARIKHLQIQSMDQIYSQAEFTVVSLGLDPTEGLSGVSVPRVQPRAYVGSYCFSATLRDPIRAMSQSLWNKRGWTSQEAFLSPRKLFFTKDQVVFQCYADLHMEAEEPHAAGFSPEYIPLMLRSDRKPAYVLGSSLTMQDHRSCLYHYNKRKLTYGSDSLNAFLGILSRFEKGPNAIQHYWGLPIDLAAEGLDPGLLDSSTSLVARFAASLSFKLWSDHTRFATRRYGFPSWSWTGWYNTSCSPDCKSYDIEDLLIQIELRNGEICNVDRFQSLGGFHLPSNELSMFIHIECRTTPVRLFQIRENEIKRGKNLGTHLAMWAEFTTESKERPCASATFVSEGSAEVGHCIGVLMGVRAHHLDDKGAPAHIILLLEERDTAFERIGAVEVLSDLGEKGVAYYDAFRSTAC